MEKVASQKSKKLTIVYFGSVDNFDMPSNRTYQELISRLEPLGEEEMKVMPLVVAGDKAVKLKVESLVLTEAETLHFEKTKSRRCPENVSRDPFVRRALTQLELCLEKGKPRFILVPFYVKLVKKKRA